MMTTTATENSRLAPRTERYQVVERLGEGGMAVVFRAVDNEERRWCALKVLLPQYRSNAVIRKRFAAEGRALYQLRHRNLIEVWDVEVDGPEPFFSMELATGGSLQDWVDLYGAMPPRMALDVTIQVCKALRVAHEKGIVHRDVKPNNVLVNRRGVCKVADFGIARHDEGVTITKDGGAMGTLGFIAPEQKDDASGVDHRADIYSVGATLHTLLLGKTRLNLYLADTEPDLMKGIPEPLRGPIIQATRYHPDQRFQSMADFARALFDARALLPDDPPDTPSLVTGDPSVYEDALHRFIPSLVPESDHPGLANNEATSSAPSLPRAMLLRSVDEPPPESGFALPKWLNPQAVLLGSLPLWALMVVLAGLTGVRATEIRAAVDQVTEHRAEIDAILDSEAPIVRELTALGTNEAAIRGAYEAARLTQGPTKSQNIVALVELAKQEVHLREPAPGAPLVHHAREVEQRIKRIEAKLGEVQQAEAWDLYVRSSGISRIAVGVGLAPDVP